MDSNIKSPQKIGVVWSSSSEEQMFLELIDWVGGRWLKALGGAQGVTETEDGDYVIWISAEEYRKELRDSRIQTIQIYSHTLEVPPRLLLK